MGANWLLMMSSGVFERIMNPNTASPCSRRIRVIKGAQEFENGQADHITGLRKIDDLTLEVTLNEAINPGYPWYDPCAAILPREEVEKDPAAFDYLRSGAAHSNLSIGSKAVKWFWKNSRNIMKQGNPIWIN